MGKGGGGGKKKKSGSDFPYIMNVIGTSLRRCCSGLPYIVNAIGTSWAHGAPVSPTSWTLLVFLGPMLLRSPLHRERYWYFLGPWCSGLPYIVNVIGTSWAHDAPVSPTSWTLLVILGPIMLQSPLHRERYWYFYNFVTLFKLFFLAFWHKVRLFSVFSASWYFLSFFALKKNYFTPLPPPAEKWLANVFFSLSAIVAESAWRNNPSVKFPTMANLRYPLFSFHGSLVFTHQWAPVRPPLIISSLYWSERDNLFFLYFFFFSFDIFVSFNSNWPVNCRFPHCNLFSLRLLMFPF